MSSVYECFVGAKHPDWDKVDETDVHAAYRIALGRPPEGSGQIEKHIAKVKDLAELRYRFISSPEFFRNNSEALVQGVVRRAYNILGIDVEVDVSPDKLARLFDHIQTVWSRLGEVEPHFSVLSTPQFKPSELSKNEAAFNQSGAREFQAAIGRIRQLTGIAPNPHGHAVEFGCGVGRVTRFISDYFAETVAYDISKPHLALAQKYLEAENVKHPKFFWISKIEDVHIPEHDFFYSRIVFQHNPPPVQKFLLERIFSKLRPGGVAMFQVVTGIENYKFNTDAYLNEMEQIDYQELHVLPQQEVFRMLNNYGLLPITVTRDASVSGFDKVSTMFIAQKITKT